MTTLLWVIAAFLILLGLAGILVPGIPGTLAVFAGLLAAAWADGFTKVGWVTIAILGAMTLASFGVDFLTTLLGAKKVGASKRALVGALVGMLIGLFFGFLGIVVGPFVGAFVGELLVRKQPLHSVKVGAATWLGLLAGTVLKLWLAFMMIGIFVLAYAFE